MRKILIYIGLLVTASGCQAQTDLSVVVQDVRSSYSDVNHISTDSLASLAAANQDVYILDTRSREEYDVSHIPGAIWIDPSDRTFPELTGVDKKTKIVAYCSVGYRSSKVARRLSAAGYDDVANLEGSIFQWANEGRQLVDGAGTASTVHQYNERWGQLLHEELRH